MRSYVLCDTRVSSSVATMTDLLPFSISVSDSELEGLAAGLRRFEWGSTPPRSGWHYGMDTAVLRGLVDHWLTAYDWRTHERAINQFPQYTTMVGGVRLHTIVERGSGADPMVLVLLHGWPYSFATFRKVIERLAHPERHGGNPEDGLTVVVPSLPGSGYSDLAEAPLGLRSAATMLNSLVVERLGFSRYLVHGGDQGAGIADWMAFDHPEHVIGLHTTLLAIRHDGAPLASGLTGVADASVDETAFVETERAYSAGPRGAYLLLQTTAPMTLVPALSDSPIGLAAWILEKFYLWAEQTEAEQPWRDAEDDLITELMIHLLSGSTASSLTAYAEYFTEPVTFPANRRIEVPSAFASYPDPHTVAPPASFVARSRNLVRYERLPHGGHFPAIEVPEIFTEDLRAFIKQLAG